MTVERGRDWGRTGPVPAGTVTVHDDAEARRVVTEARRTGAPPPPLRLLGGDLCRTLGGRGEAPAGSGERGTLLTVDLGSALVDGRLHWFVAHVLARRRWWRGPVVAVCNAQWIGPWDVAPRAHPADGLLDVIEADLGLGDRLEARRRLPSGTHVPHPGIRVRRTAAAQIDLPPGTTVRLDGEAAGEARTLSVRIEPDALQVVV